MIDLPVTSARAHILRVAEATLTTAQLRVFVLHWFDGRSIADIARTYECSRPAVYQSLWGQRKAVTGAPVGGAVKKLHNALQQQGGLMSKLGIALDNDPELKTLIAELKKPDDPPPTEATTDIVGWYRGCRSEDFASLAVLHVCAALADAQGKLSMQTLTAEVPMHIAQQAVRVLRLRGWVASDGINIRVLKRPNDKEVQA